MHLPLSFLYFRVWILKLTWLCSHHAAFGAAYGTAKSGTGIAAMAVMRPELIMKSIVPVVMAGIIAIYGLVVAVLIGNSMDPKNYSLFEYVALSVNVRGRYLELFAALPLT